VTSSSQIIDKVRAALQPHGLFVRGVVSQSRHPELMPTHDPGMPIQTVVLIGPKGGSNWSHFRAWQSSQTDRGGADPLDNWSKAVLTPIAENLGAAVWFPSDPPWQPFQSWAKAAEGLKPSPLGLLIHPEFGVWHSYRGALGFDVDLGNEPGSEKNHPCDKCAERPCLSACPVHAITENGFAVASCRAHLKTEPGQAGCVKSGCLARNACPVGAGWRYSDDQLQFHMAALG